MSACACGERWRVEGCVLSTGQILGPLHPIAFEWSTELNGFGSGTFTFATKDIESADIWPHLRSIFVTRLTDNVHYGFYVDAFSASSSLEGGTTRVGVKVIEDYLNHRLLRTDLTFVNIEQTDIATALVAQASTSGIPLTALTTNSTELRDRTYNAYDRHVIGEAISNLSGVSDGIDWEIVHARSGGFWSSQIIFRDEAGLDKDLIIASDREGSTYGLDVSAANQANLVDAIGAGEGDGLLIATAQDLLTTYPRFDSAPAWKDVTDLSVLQEYADGYLIDHREAVAIPSVTIAGPSTEVASLVLGDRITVALDHGTIAFHGRARVTGMSWKVSAESPDELVLDLVPLDRSSTSVLGQIANVDCGDC